MSGFLGQWLPAEGIKILVALSLSFLIGLEREEHRTGVDHYGFGGVRTFPLIGLIGYSVALLSGPQVLPVILGFLVVGAFLLVSYRHKLEAHESAGITTEVSGLATYLVGALVSREQFWIATTLSVITALLLELKPTLEGLAGRIPQEEIFTFTKFLLLTAVVLPVLPTTNIGPFPISPFKIWLVVVAVSAVSYGSYVLQSLTKTRGGLLLAAVLGGAYSSTITTVALAKGPGREEHGRLVPAAILTASGIMYLRLVVLVGLFNRSLLLVLAPGFLSLAAVAIAVGWLWSRGNSDGESVPREFKPRNPLALGTALLFGLLLVVMLTGTHLVASRLGNAGVYTLAAFMGITDVDPFIMGLTQAAGTLTSLSIASSGIIIAAASNNVVKGIYAYCLARRDVGLQSLLLLLGLAGLGLVPLLW
jgi:uncharacterized membrane protein (DUF4010 family)